MLGRVVRLQLTSAFLHIKQGRVNGDQYLKQKRWGTADEPEAFKWIKECQFYLECTNLTKWRLTSAALVHTGIDILNNTEPKVPLKTVDQTACQVMTVFPSRVLQFTVRSTAAVNVKRLHGPRSWQDIISTNLVMKTMTAAIKVASSGGKTLLIPTEDFSRLLILVQYNGPVMY